MRTLIGQLEDELVNTQEDLNYHQAILDGSWPQATKILLRSLKKARAIRARTKEEVCP